MKKYRNTLEIILVIVQTKTRKSSFNELDGLILDTVILGIARMKEIEESFDNSKTVPSLIAATVFMLTQIFNYYTDDEMYRLFLILVSYIIFFVFSICY